MKAQVWNQVPQIILASVSCYGFRSRSPEIRTVWNHSVPKISRVKVGSRTGTSTRSMWGWHAVPILFPHHGAIGSADLEDGRSVAGNLAGDPWEGGP